jgi:aminomethyltransferase
VLEDRGVLRSHQKVVVAGVGEGEMTSGTFSPTLDRSIGFARVRPRRATGSGRYPRQAPRGARSLKYPFRAQWQSIDLSR